MDRPPPPPEKRYVAYPLSWLPGQPTPENAKAIAVRNDWWPGDSVSPVVYEIGPEVKEPDTTLLIKYIKDYGHGKGCALKHYAECEYMRRADPCSCGLATALEAAGVVE